MTIQELLTYRYATKKFTEKKLTAEQLALLKEAIKLSPSSFNAQPWHVHIVTDQQLKDRLKPHAWGQEQIASCSHLFIFTVPKDIPRVFEDLFSLMQENKTTPERLDGLRGMIAGTLKPLSPEQQLAWMQRQVYLAAMSLMLQAAELGLDSCPMEGFVPDAFGKELGVTDAVVTMLVPVGYRADAPVSKLRFGNDHIFSAAGT